MNGHEKTAPVVSRPGSGNIQNKKMNKIILSAAKVMKKNGNDNKKRIKKWAWDIKTTTKGDSPTGGGKRANAMKKPPP